MNDFELVGPNGTDVNNEFLKAYRDALKNQYEANVSSLKQQKRNADAQIMSAANKAGMMYSNFPQRSKIQSETDYLNNLSKTYSTYQTGLDSLRNNAVNAYNQIKAYEEAISDINKASAGGGGGYSTVGGTSGSSGKNIAGGIPDTITDGDGSKSGSGEKSKSFLEPMINGVSNSFDKMAGQSNVYHGGNVTTKDLANAAKNFLNNSKLFK